MTTFRAAYIADDGSSTSGGFLLTSKSEKYLSDDQLLAIAESVKTQENLVGEIVIGDWRE